MAYLLRPVVGENSTKPTLSDTEPLLAIVGLGTTGSNAVRYLIDDAADGYRFRLAVHDINDRAVARAVSIAAPAVATEAPILPSSSHQPSVTILATPCGTHVSLATRLLRSGSSVVSMSDAPHEVTQLLELDALAKRHGVSMVVGAGMAPGLSCLLSRHAGDQMDQVDSINIAKAGTAGPACARQHHRALKQPGRDWVGNSWELRGGGSGRDLAWFPEPIGARDCYRGALPSPILLHRQYPEAQRLSARVSATRRDRMTSRLPMLRKPHQDGGPGAVRTAVRGWRDGRVETIVYAAMAFPSVAAAVVAVVACRGVLAGQAPAGASGLSEWDDPGALLAEVRRRGITISAFGGVGSEDGIGAQAIALSEEVPSEEGLASP